MPLYRFSLFFVRFIFSAKNSSARAHSRAGPRASRCRPALLRATSIAVQALADRQRTSIHAARQPPPAPLLRAARDAVLLVPSRRYLHALGKQGTGRRWSWRKRISAAERLQAAGGARGARRRGQAEARIGTAAALVGEPARRSWRRAGGCAASGEERTAAERVTWPISPCAASHVDLPFAAASSSALDPARSPAYTTAAESALEASARRMGFAACRCCKVSRRGRQHGLMASSKSQIRFCFF
jgi:hypothetical protein